MCCIRLRSNEVLVSSLLLCLVPSENSRRESTIVICATGCLGSGMHAYIPPQHLSSVKRQPRFVTGSSAGLEYHPIDVLQHEYYTCTSFSCSKHSWLSIDVFLAFKCKVTSLCVISSRCGILEELKELIETAHGTGPAILLDVVHSYICKNILDGINQLHGTDHYLYLHEGDKGQHELWVSCLFNYGMLLFLLCNLRFYVDEYKFDGFQLDGVTSMIHKHHGIGAEF